MMDGGASPALELALQHIFHNKLIKERHTLLTGRLVCRTWRACRTFSGAITTVTLHTPADVQLAADLFADTPRQRPPWPSVEESRAFPNLKTLKISKYLATQLNESGPLRDMLAAIKNVDVDLELDLVGDRPSMIHALAGLVSSLTLKWKKVEELGLSASIASGGALTRLRRLKVHDIIPLAMNRPIVMDLAQCFSTVAALSQLTRLDFDELISFDGDIDAVRRQLNDLAPTTLKEVRVVLYPGTTDFCVKEGCQLHAVLKDGLLVTEHAKCVIEIKTPQELDWKISKHLSDAAQYTPLSPKLEIKANCRLERFAVDLSELASKEDLNLSVYHEPWKQDDELRSARIYPALTSKVSPMETTRLKFKIWGDGWADLNSMVDSLPTLMPHLQHLTLNVFTVSYQHITSIHQLTKLTHLQMHIYSYDDLSSFLFLELSPFPSSLRELDLAGTHMRLPSLANLGHLTKLVVTQDSLMQSDEPEWNCTWDSLYACPAPLQDLKLEGWHLKLDLSLLVQAFPHLEVMDVSLDNPDIRSLSSLSRLRDLSLHFRGSASKHPSQEMSLMGLDALTGLSSLKVEKASCYPDSLSNLGKLTQLRHLEYGLASYGPTADWTSRWQKVTKQLQLSMPRTRISMSLQ